MDTLSLPQMMYSGWWSQMSVRDQAWSVLVRLLGGWSSCGGCETPPIPDGSQPARLGESLLPRTALVLDEGATEPELRVDGQDQPGPAVG